MHAAEDIVLGIDVAKAALDVAVRPSGVVRSHWCSENTVHYVRDVTLGEDARTNRSRAAPRVRAALRNAVLGLLHQRRWPNIPAPLRHYAWRPATHVLRLLGILLA